ncbi:diguanylate cyclase [Dehalococcoidia bacterium]|nr:diguanylate cyclase [Dehalococcoidia bacterium]
MNIWAIIPLISLLTFVALFILVLQQAGRRVDKVFALFLFASGAWSFTSFMLISNPYASTQYLIFWNVMVITAIPWVAVSYYYFVRAYNNKPGGIGVYLGYTFVPAMLGLGLAGYVVKDAYIIGGYLHHDIGPWRHIIGGIILPFLLCAMLMLVQRYRGSTDPTERNRVTYLITGSGIAIVGGYVAAFTPALAGLPVDHLGTLANALIIAYAIRRYQLLSIRFVIRRGLAYSLLVASLVAIYVGARFLGQRFFPAWPIYSVLFAAPIVLLLALLARPLRHVIEERLDRFFYRGTQEYRLTLLSFSSKMSNILSLDELANEMLSAMTKGIGITHAELLLQDTSSGDFITQFTYPEVDGGSSDELRFKADTPIVTWLEKEGSPLRPEQIDSIPELKGFWQSERERITTSNPGLLCPIKSRGRLIGILALGKKRSGTPYSVGEIQLVMNAATQAGILIENAQLYCQATLRANTDELTGLYNHSHFHERLDQEITRSSRFGTTFSLIMLDIDLFKAYNDTYGHLAGNQVLRKIGDYIRSSIRSLDMAFRYGGEEFTVILPEAQLDDAYKVAERIRKTIESETSSGVMPVTVSLGIANWPSDGVTHNEIIARADAALYQAKRTGRNWTCLPTDTVKPETPLVGLESEVRWGALSIIYALAAAVDAKDHYTYGHSKKVSEYAVAIAKELGLPQEKIVTIRVAGLLHDIGKIGIPDSLLGKEGALTEEEWKPVKTHPELGVEILRHVGDLVNCLPAILHHHEHYDGKGYPFGLKGEDIPLEARILAISDAYDAITSPRAYREGLSSQQALDQIRHHAGTQFDPELVEVFCNITVTTQACPPAAGPGVQSSGVPN